MVPLKQREFLEVPGEALQSCFLLLDTVWSDYNGRQPSFSGGGAAFQGLTAAK